MPTLVGRAWSRENYRAAIDRAVLRLPVKRTLHAMLMAGGGEYSTIDRATLCQLTGVRREATITQHWNRAREAGLLVSRARYNRSSIHRFTLPGQRDIDCVIPWIELGLQAHEWTTEELEWWQHQRPESPIRPPWGDGCPPF